MNNVLEDRNLLNTNVETVGNNSVLNKYGVKDSWIKGLVGFGLPPKKAYSVYS